MGGALALAQEGIAIAEAVGSPISIAYNLVGLAGALRQRGDLAGCRTHLRAAWETATAAKLVPAQTTILYEFALLLQTEAAAIPDENLPIRHETYAQAFKLSRLVAAHPAAIHLYRQRAAALSNALLNTLQDTPSTNTGDRNNIGLNSIDAIQADVSTLQQCVHEQTLATAAEPLLQVMP